MKEGGAAQSTVRTEEQAGEPSVVRSGKWKIPSSTDYLDLFKGLLDCENMKVTTFILLLIYLIYSITFGWPHKICTS